MNKATSPSDTQQDALAEEVAAWFLRMQQEDCSEADRREFEAWLAESEDRREEYRQYEALWHDLDRLGSLPKQPSRRKAGALMGIVAGLAVVLTAANWYANLGETISTAVGERRHVVLADGTAVDMNTGSKIRVRMDDKLRRIILVKGEVLVEVARDARPFEVHAADGVLRDIGTVFNVRDEGDHANVAVLEGEVQVVLAADASLHLRGGQQMDYTAEGHGEVARADVAEVTAWLNGRLIFRDTPLQEVVNQINRYHSRPVKLADDKLAALKVSGEFNSADRDGLLQALTILLSLESSEHLGTTELSPRY
ncbi:MAG: FecR family protein [Sideroxyarcus sp.]|nr:FecR family protein [Sideroxyarcus sp.]